LTVFGLKKGNFKHEKMLKSTVKKPLRR